MNSNCRFFESITKKWAYCSEKDEFQLKEDEALCNDCQYKPEEEVKK